MTTTNNEPLGGDDLPISMSTYGSLEECEKERARRASQQSGAAGASEVKPWQERRREGHDFTAAVLGEISDLRAQLARQRQGSGEPVYQSQYSDKHPEVWVDCSKRQYDLYVEHGEGKIPVRVLYTTPAPQAQGEPAEVRQYRGVGQLAWFDLTPDLEATVRQAPELYQFRTLYTAPVAQGEPVAWITFRTKDGRETLKEGCVATNRAYTEAHSQWVWEPLGRLVKPSAQADEGRDAALEEAARICEDEDHKLELGRNCAVAIRALRTTAADNQEG